MMMTCGRARLVLWPDGGPRAATVEVEEARAHVSGCERCRQFFEDMRRVSGWLHDVVHRPEAPVAVRDRLFKAIARARTGTARIPRAIAWHRRLVSGLVAAVLLGGVWLGYVALRSHVTPDSDSLSAIVEDHVRAQSGAGLVSDDSLEVTQWLASRLSFAVQVPIFPEARLAGARVFLTHDRQPGAVIEYEIGDESLSYYVFPTAGKGLSPPRQIRLVSRLGYRVAGWDDAGLTHALVAALPEPRLLALAQYCIHQMMAVLTPNGGLRRIPATLRSTRASPRPS